MADKRTKIYTCYNDCTPGGCPSHEMSLTYFSVTDQTLVEFQGREYYFDPTTLKTFLELLHGMDEQVIKSVLKPLTPTAQEGTQT